MLFRSEVNYVTYQSIATHTFYRGDKLASRSFAAFYFKEGHLIAADCINRPQEFMLSKKIIAENIVIEASRLEDESISVKELLSAE